MRDRRMTTLTRPADDRPLLRVAGVGKSFDNGQRALNGIEFEIARGEFVSLVGPSGCGKSSLLRLLAGLSRPNEGEITWGASEQGSGGPRLGFVFQEPTLMPWRTVGGNVAMPLRLRGCPPAEAKRRVRDALSLVGLEQFAASYPRQLSGGMKMRASIARALVVQPQVLLLDEPFAALDELTREQLNEDLLKLQQTERWTVIFVTHSVHEAVFLSSRVLIMSPRPGRIVHDISMDGVVVRDDAYRTSVAYAVQCRQVSGLLHAAMGGKRRVARAEPRVNEVSVFELEASLRQDPHLVVVDVRENDEVAAGMIAGAIHIRLGDLPARYTELPESGPIHFICRGGGRSARACLFLYKQGWTDAVSVAGGMEAWQSARRPVTVLENDRGDPSEV